jgi:hypothetical protein
MYPISHYFFYCRIFLKCMGGGASYKGGCCSAKITVLFSLFSGRTENVEQVKLEMHSMRLTFWRDLCDVFIPLSGLGYVNSGLGAFCGLVSSLIGFHQEWEKNVRACRKS